MKGLPIKIIEWLYNQDKNTIFEIKKYKKQRNKDQNKRYWKTVGEISLATKLSIEEIHFNLLKQYSPRYEIFVYDGYEIRGIDYYEKKSRIVKNGKEYTVYIVYTPSHELKTDEFAILLQGAIDEAKELGIDTRSPEEIRRDEAIYDD